LLYERIVLKIPGSSFDRDKQLISEAFEEDFGARGREHLRVGAPYDSPRGLRPHFLHCAHKSEKSEKILAQILHRNDLHDPAMLRINDERCQRKFFAVVPRSES